MQLPRTSFDSRVQSPANVVSSRNAPADEIERLMELLLQRQSLDNNMGN
jgi:hypothetical protein